MRPYYVDELVTLYCEDARAVMGAVDVRGAVVLTDPVWPDARAEGPHRLAGAEDPAGLFRDVAAPLEAARLLTVILGPCSDPRFLAGVPAVLPYARQVALRYARPSHHGPVLYDRDIAYLYGRLRVLHRGGRVLPGEIVETRGRARAAWRSAHPCPRSVDHVDKLVSWYAAPEELLVDPFAGSGTLLEVAVRRRRRVLAVEVDREFCREIVERIRWAGAQAVLPGVP